MKTVRWLATFGCNLILLATANAGILVEHPSFDLTIDGFVNFSTGFSEREDVIPNSDADDYRIDGDIRLLALHENANGTKWGGRVTLEASSDENIDFAELGEYSFLVLGRWGRLEIGERQGLPDVLTGFAPNNYSFTSSEYGPATGTNLNPAGGLQTSFLDSSLAGQINNLSPLGFVASLASDRSFKIIFAAPRTKNGLTMGISFSPNADESPGDFKELVQTGLTFDHFWSNNQLHIGGSYTYGNGDSISLAESRNDMHSLNVGAAVTLADALNVGVSATYNGDSGLVESPANQFDSDALGWVTSVNYNKGPWTFGGYFQQARAEGDGSIEGNDELEAIQIGVSYRFNVRTRLYGAYYYYEFDNEGGTQGQDQFDGNVIIIGFRVIL